MTPGCFGTQTLGHSYGYQSHTHQYLEVKHHSCIAIEHTLVNMYKNMTQIQEPTGNLRPIWLTFAIVVVGEFVACPTADLSLATE